MASPTAAALLVIACAVHYWWQVGLLAVVAWFVGWSTAGVPPERPAEGVEPWRLMLGLVLVLIVVLVLIAGAT